ncbi:helix-turn-helix transcriptional regulator [Rhodococcus sp. JVH1]|uniref:helix-turn-helix domain-containing protein n=1 Tax=Rhodococcus sp. JVH1 TaxID=745408 RepID=UPI0005C18FEC|nr:helix-turn-helix transcriptional regulator [Rhodococcus sp. JVH1]
MPTLADLISARKSERGWSYQQLAGRANDVVSRQRWQQLGTGVRIKEFPEPTTIQAIADALEVDVTLVVLSVARSIGFAVRTQDSSLAAMLPPGADELNEEQRDAVLAVVRAMAPRRTAGVANDTNQKPGTEASGQELGSSGRGAESSGAPMKLAVESRHLSSASKPEPTPEQLAELARVQKDWKDRVKPTEWTLNDQGQVVDRHGVPPFDESKMLAAHRIPDEMAGVYPPEVEVEPDQDGPEFGA